MKINLKMHRGYDPVKAEVHETFKLFDLTFCVIHPHFTNGFDEDSYAVTEYSTGLRVWPAVHETKQEAIDYTKILLLQTGEYKVKQKVDKEIKECGILNKE